MKNGEVGLLPAVAGLSASLVLHFHSVLSAAGPVLLWLFSDLPTPENLCFPRAKR